MPLADDINIAVVDRAVDARERTTFADCNVPVRDDNLNVLDRDRVAPCPPAPDAVTGRLADGAASPCVVDGPICSWDRERNNGDLAVPPRSFFVGTEAVPPVEVGGFAGRAPRGASSACCDLPRFGSQEEKTAVAKELMGLEEAIPFTKKGGSYVRHRYKPLDSGQRVCIAIDRKQKRAFSCYRATDHGSERHRVTCNCASSWSGFRIDIRGGDIVREPSQELISGKFLGAVPLQARDLRHMESQAMPRQRQGNAE